MLTKIGTVILLSLVPKSAWIVPRTLHYPNQVNFDELKQQNNEDKLESFFRITNSQGREEKV